MKIHTWKNRESRIILPNLIVCWGGESVDIVIGWWKWNLEFVFSKEKEEAPF